MRLKFPRLIHLWIACIVLASLTACDAVRMVIATPTPLPTETPLPTSTPLPTDTPPPPPTFTPLPSETPTLPPAPTLPPPPSPTAPLTDPILVYYINKNDKGPWGCNEALWWVKTNQNRSSSLANDVTYALRTILSYHNPEFGDLYNPGYASNLAVASVEVRDDGTVVVSLTGTYNKTDDRCDGPRFRDQLRQTIKQFPNVVNIVITINGTPIADVIARK